MDFPDLNFTRRHCVNNEASSERYCYEGGNPVSFCGRCYDDECNGASQYSPAATIVGILIAFLKLFSFL